MVLNFTVKILKDVHCSVFKMLTSYCCISRTLSLLFSLEHVAVINVKLQAFCGYDAFLHVLILCACSVIHTECK